MMVLVVGLLMVFPPAPRRTVETQWLDTRAVYANAFAKIAASGCVPDAASMTAAEMNCVLNHYGIAYRVVSGELVNHSMELLEELAE